MIILDYNEVIFAVISLPFEFFFVAVSFVSVPCIVVIDPSNFTAFFIRFLPLNTLKIIIYEQRPQIKPNQAET